MVDATHLELLARDTPIMKLESMNEDYRSGIKGKIKPVRIVDVLGHSRLRPKLDKFLPQATSIVFAVHALEFRPNYQAVSEYLYDILTRASVVRKKIPVLILCNKVDKVTAHTKEFIRKQLEKEMYELKVNVAI
ncbi:signal recognition particle receptor subunit beta-like [Camellia sinensis]|uniref:signal recognition particle receptor subunit beta-like n=1 Tax=Camellia sinensis TaxID=4442 RepID=UPI001036A30F|nr:signal recognition particle receptor subunit beta-like [Camellia sinensis]